MTQPRRPGGARPIDELLDTVRARIDRIQPTEVAGRVARAALLVNTGPWEQRSRDGAVPGAVVIDHSSCLVADTLRSLGLTRTVDVVGGFVAWAAAGLPVVPATLEDVAA